MHIFSKTTTHKLCGCLGILLLPLTLPAQTTEISLDSTNPQIRWTVAPQETAGTDLAAVSRADYRPAGDWIPAVVPGTVFNAYVEAGLEKDPNFGDNIYRVERSRYDRPFVYRAEFTIPAGFTKDKIWLNFRGINRKGEIYLNGERLGALDGFMERGRYDITKRADRNGKNYLAVVVDIPEHPLNNYGSPTYISSGGWDWMPYVPGLNSGITDRVYLSNTGALQLDDPWIRTELPTNARAELSVTVGINNSTSSYREGRLRLKLQPGDIELTQKVGVEPGRTAEIKLDPSQFTELTIHRPKLWWPNGYGEPNLYTCELALEVDGEVSDARQIPFGIRKYTYDKEDGVFHIAVNGKRIFVKGGNWGMSEYLLRCRDKEYDTKIRLHREMNMNMIRNWLGSVTDDAFYDACDRYGILVWDDFWLNANPVLPKDIHAFNRNAAEKIRRLRNHPCIAVWCGNNEGFPVPPLNEWLKENVAVFDGNDRYYQHTSNSDGLSGSGMWGNFDPRWYFTAPRSSTHGNLGWGFRTEIGTAVFPNYESLKKFIPADKLWPRNEMWDLHFFGPRAFNALPDRYDASIAERYGAPAGIEDYCRKAQLLNLETNQAMYEGWTDRMWENASGIMTWMSQSAYPSMVWQTYDYYYDLTGAYWGLKKACEPLHIQWNPVTNAIKAINTTASDAQGFTAEAAVYNGDGSEVTAYRRTLTLDVPSNTAVQCFDLPFYRYSENLALHKPAVASSSDGGRPAEVTDGNPDSRWASRSSDNEWIYVDLQQPANVFGVCLNFEAAYAKHFKIQVSDDAVAWRDVAEVDQGRKGKQEIFFDDTQARYVRMLGLERGTGWGYSLWDFQVYGGTGRSEGLDDVHFIRLRLKDASGKTVSENTYWRGTVRTDFTALNRLPEVRLKTDSKLTRCDGTCYLDIRVTNPASSPAVAFAVWLQLHHPDTGERLLPAILSDNYFTLLKGETRLIRAEFDEKLLGSGKMPRLTVEAYNNR